MRYLLVIAAAAALSACATQAPTPAPTPAPAPAAAEPAKPAAKAPQCWSADASAFFDVGAKTTISGVAVECKPTSDGKAAQWMSAKHH